MTCTPWLSVLLVAAALASATAVKRDPCPCPFDNFDDTGVLINQITTFQCAFPTGACAYDASDGALLNTAQLNCLSPAPACESETDINACGCPNDLTGATGQPTTFGSANQCAYANGACMFNSDGSLMNAMGQGNCPFNSGCPT